MKRPHYPESSLAAREVETIILGYPEVKEVLTKVGAGSRGRITINDPSLSEIYVQLVDKSERSFSSAQFARHIKYHVMSEVPGVKVRPIDINIIGLRDDDAVQVTLSSDKESELKEVTEKVSGILRDIDGAVEVQNSIESGVATIVAEPLRHRMDLLNVDPARVGITLRTALEGNKDFTFHGFEDVLPIDIALKKERLNEIRDLKDLAIISDDGKLMKLSEVTSIEEERRYNRLERTNRQRSATVQSQVYGRPAGSVSRSFQASITSSDLSENIQLEFGGATKRTREGILSMLTALVVSIILVYAVLAILYNSFGMPLVILVSLPLATIGSFLLLALTGEALSIFSIMGLIILAGLVGKNAILVIDVSRKLMLNGQERHAALIDATRLRLRPILMTNLTMIIGLLPIALSSGAGSEWKNGLAWALIGGLSSSMLLSLVVVPVIYDLAFQFKQRLTSGTDRRQTSYNTIHQ